MRNLFILVCIGLMSSALFAADKIEKRIFISASEHFALGVVISDPDQDTLKDLKLDGGAEILEVLDDSEAERIGLENDDIIVKFDGVSIKDAEQLSDQVDKMEKPKTVKFEVKRDGKSKNFTANLKETESSETHKIKVDIDEDLIDIDIDDMPSLPKILRFPSNDKGGYLGVEVENLSEQMLEYFEVKQGVLIEAVTEDGPAQKIGLKAGDIIIKINDRTVADYSDLVRTLNFYNPGEKVTVHYVRKGKSKNVKVELAKKSSSDKIHKIRKIKRFDEDGEDFIWHADKHQKVIEKKMKRLEKKQGKMLKKINLKLFII